jgi:cytochrome c
MRNGAGGRTMRLGRRFAGAMAVAVALAACTRDRRSGEASALAQGDPERGAELIRKYGCGSCHTIPGIPGARTTVGPPLAGIAGRAYVAGVVPNTPDNLVDWIHNPPQVDSKTAMPYLGVSKAEARDIAAYLYTLR